MRTKGYLYECNRCGKTEFRVISDREDYDGLPISVAPVSWSFKDSKYLCPCCTDLYNQMMNNFYAPEVKRPLELDDSSREVVNGRVVL